MKQLFVILGLTLAVSACAPTTKTPNDFPQLLKQTEGFEDCKIAALSNSVGTVLYVVRCPNSNTSLARPGKHPIYTTVMDSDH